MRQVHHGAAAYCFDPLPKYLICVPAAAAVSSAWQGGYASLSPHCNKCQTSPMHHYPSPWLLAYSVPVYPPAAAAAMSFALQGGLRIIIPSL